ELKGKCGRIAGGGAVYQMVSELVFRTTSTDRTVVQAVVAAANAYGHGRVVVEDPLAGGLSYRKLLLGVAVLARKLAPLAETGEAVGGMLPECDRTAGPRL